MEVTANQRVFFDKLLSEKEFPPGSPDPDTLKSQFDKLNKASASEWIEKALKLPNKGTVDEPITSPAF